MTENIPAKAEQGKLSEVPGKYCVRDINLADKGRLLLDWAESRMPVMNKLREEYKKNKTTRRLYYFWVLTCY